MEHQDIVETIIKNSQGNFTADNNIRLEMGIPLTRDR